MAHVHCCLVASDIGGVKMEHVLRHLWLFWAKMLIQLEQGYMVKVAKLPTSTNHPSPRSKSGWEANAVERCSQPSLLKRFNTHTRAHARCATSALCRSSVWNCDLQHQFTSSSGKSFLLKYRKFLLQWALPLRSNEIRCEYCSKHTHYWPFTNNGIGIEGTSAPIKSETFQGGNVHISVLCLDYL